MEYFKDVNKTVKILEYAKQAYKDEYDKFHKFNLELLGANPQRDNFYTFLKKVVLMDVQSRPNNLSKYKVLKVFDSLENLKEDFTEKNLKEKFKDNKDELLKYFYNNLDSIKYIGPKITNLIVKNVFYFGDTEKHFGFKKKDILPLLRAPIDMHVKNLLCYRLQLSPVNLYSKISSDNDKFQKELTVLCGKSEDLIPIDLDILWYIGYQNCNRRVYCNNCRIKKYCEDTNFEIETINKIKDKKRQKEEINFVKNHSGHYF